MDEPERSTLKPTLDTYIGKEPTVAVKPLPRGTQSAGGMPEQVKCLHALVAHELAVGGVNPFGREALDAVGEWWLPGPCVPGPCS